MKGNSSTSNQGTTETNASIPTDCGIDSNVEFPPLPWKKVDMASTSALAIDILNNIVEVNGEAMNTNDGKGKQQNLKPTMKGNRVPYANLFKSNRRAKIDFKLEKVDTSVPIPEFGIDDIDSVETTYGICLLGYVISGKPPTAALFDLVKRWGGNIEFQTHESGWIVFKFPSKDVRSRILEGGSYMVFGYHLFLKEMPVCFRFREEDMNSLPTWVQIHGLPPDCWNHKVLSKLTSYVGTPVHMDLLTHERKRMKYARVLVEIDISKPKVEEMEIVIPIGKVKVQFQYEHDYKPCEYCHKPGHAKENCFVLQNKQSAKKYVKKEVVNRGRSKSVVGKKKKGGSRSISRPPTNDTNVASSSKIIQHIYENLPEGAEFDLDEFNGIGMDDGIEKEVPGKDITRVEENLTMCEQTEIPRVDKGKKPMEFDFQSFEDGPIPKTVPVVSKPTVAEKKMKNKNKKKNKKSNEGKQEVDEEMKIFFGDLEDEGSCDTEYVDGSASNNNKRFFGNEEKGRHPKSASGKK